ncbi:ABC transporter permease [Spirillospora sp. CA-253888]
MVRTEAPPQPVPDSRIEAPLRRRDRIALDLRAVRVLWQREVIRLVRSPLRIGMGLLTPLMFLLILGTGLSSAAGTTADGFKEFRTFLFPGVLLMAVQAPAMAVGTSIVWDRQAGFLRQMLVAPVRRGALLVGIALGGATTGAAYGALVLAVAGVAGIRYDLRLLLVLVELAATALTFTAIAVCCAVCIRRVESFQVVVSLSMMPLLFLSGAMFPVGGLPGWLGGAVLANPLTYAVDAIRRTLPGGGPDLQGRAAGPQWWGWTPPVALELGLIVLIALTALAVAAHRFSRTE